MIFLYWNGFGQGLIFDEDEFNQSEHFDGERAAIILEAFSLKKYTPYVFEQQYSTCVAYATATALTMMHAISNKETNKAHISLTAISPHWIYFRNKDKSDISCYEGLNIEKTMNDVLNHGALNLFYVEYSDYYPFSEKHLCKYNPSNYKSNLEKAKKNKPDKYVRIKYVEDIKYMIYKKIPVVIGMYVPESFETAKGKTLWTPKPDESRLDGYGHSVVVVGYDNNKYGGAFEILNSWGENWGDNGYIWIRYNDFKKYFIGGYALYKAYNIEKEPLPLIIKKLGKSLNMDNKDSDLNTENKKSNAANPWQMLLK